MATTATTNTTRTSANTWSVVAGNIVGNACSTGTSRVRDASAGSNTTINRRESPIVAEFGPNSGVANRSNAGASGGINSPGIESPVGQLAVGFAASFIDRGIDAALNGGSLKDVFSGSINDALSGALNNAISQLPPEVQGIFQQAFGNLTGGLAGAFGGAATPFVPPVTRDTFLQGVAGSLSDIVSGGISNLVNQLPTTVGNLLNSTSLTGALGGVAANLGSNLGNALGGMAASLGNAAGQLASGLGDAISNIPGIGPAIQNFTSAVGNFGTNLTNAFNGLPDVGQAIVGTAIGAVGSNLLCDRPRTPRLSETDQTTVRTSLKFGDNPAGNCETISSTAQELDKLIYPVTRNNVFADVANKSRIAGQELKKCIRYTDGSYSFINNIDRANSNINNSFLVVNNSIVSASQTFEQTLPQNYVDLYQTNLSIIQAEYGAVGGDLYVELISAGKPLSTETRQYYTELQSSGQLVDFMVYVTQFLNVYRRTRVLR